MSRDRHDEPSPEPEPNASDAAFTCCGFAFSRPACTGLAADLAPALGNGTAVLVVTVFAMARTSSRLKAMGLEAALRLRMLSRRAVFFEGFSMGGEFLAGLPLGAGFPFGTALPLVTDLPFGAALTATVRTGAGWAFFGAGFGVTFGADFFLAEGFRFWPLGIFEVS